MKDYVLRSLHGGIRSNTPSEEHLVMKSYQVSERPDSCLDGRHLRSDRTEEDDMSLKISEEL